MVRTIQKNLKYHGLTVNPYDRCIAKIIIYGNQCTIAYYVDYNKVLHIDEEVNNKIIDTLDKHFGKITVTRENQ